MRRSLQLATVFLTASLGATTLFAQGHGHRDGGGQGGRSSGPTPSGSGGANMNHGGSHSSSGSGRTLSTQPSPGYVSPFQQEIHLNPPTSGCYDCGGYYGGGYYGGYAGNYNP